MKESLKRGEVQLESHSLKHASILIMGVPCRQNLRFSIELCNTNKLFKKFLDPKKSVAILFVRKLKELL